MDRDEDETFNVNDMSLKRSSEVSPVQDSKRPCVEEDETIEPSEDEVKEKKSKRSSRRSRKSRGGDSDDAEKEEQKPKRKSRRSRKTAEDEEEVAETKENIPEVESFNGAVENEDNGSAKDETTQINEQVEVTYENKNITEETTKLEERNEEKTEEPSPEGENDEEIQEITEIVDNTMSTEPAEAPHQATESARDDEIVEVMEVPEKDKPEMIVLDDINHDDDTPGPDEVPTAEERGFWKAVEENPNDFASWTYLLQVVEKNGKLKQIQKAFSSFLALYPYCYGYWKKYADQMIKLVSNEAAYEVYNDAVIAIPLSVDLWTYFIHFIAEWKNGDEEEIRTIYQRAVAACGQDFRSDKIWEAFVEWEKQTDNFRVLALYKDFLSCVIQRHQFHFDKFREWIFFTPVKDVVTMADIQELLARHKVETERRRVENEERIKVEAEKARLAEEAAVKVAEEQKKEAEEEERKLQEEIKRMQDDYKAATGYVDAKTDEVKIESEEGDTQEIKADETKADETDEVKVDEMTTEVKEEEKSDDMAMESEDAAVPQQDEEEDNEDAVEKEEENVVVCEDKAETEQQKEETEQVTASEEFEKVDIEEPLPDTPDALTAKQEAAIREQILLDMAPLHEQVLANIQEVTPFEEGIKRPYFHVKELERVQLKNWKNYLNLIIEKNDEAKTIILFERCLIACAFYEGFWIKYISFMKKIDLEETRKIYRRACIVHLVKKPQIHLNWAAFEEQNGHLEVAREALDHIDKGLPGLISVILRRAGLERRNGNIEQGADILKAAIESCRGRETRDFWVMKYVSYVQYTLKDIPTAKQFLLEQIERNTRNKRLYVRLLDLEMSPSSTPPDTAAVMKVLQSALNSNLSIEDKTGFSHRRLTFLEEFTDDISLLSETYEDHNKNYKAVVDEKKKETSQSQTKDYKRRDNSSGSNPSNTNNTNNNSSYRSYNSRDRNYNNRDRNYNNTNNQSNYNTSNQQPQNNYNPGYNMGGYNMQQAQQQHYQQWYSQYAAQQQQQQYAGQGQFQQSRGY